jgi:spermidine synthase
MSRRTVVLLVFTLSGAAGLIYEVVWSRQLILVFGNTTQALATILTGYFGGMAVGSYFGGRTADRSGSPLKLYASVELLLAAYVVATPFLFGVLHEVYRAAYATLVTHRGAVALVRLALAIVALFPATMLLGATLPILSRFLARRTGELGEAFGSLYTANTLGAILGTVLAGGILIELLGLKGTLGVGAALSVLAALLALHAARPLIPPGEKVPEGRMRGPVEQVPEGRMRGPVEQVPEGRMSGPVEDVPEGRMSGPVEDVPEGRMRWPVEPHPGVPPDLSPCDETGPDTRRTDWALGADDSRIPEATRRRLALLAAFVSGLTSLGYQLLWTRLLSSGTGNITYVFTLVLASFLTGIALGAGTLTTFPPPPRWRVPLLGLAQSAIGLVALVGAVLVSGWAGQLSLLGNTVCVVLPATLMLGVSLPLSSSLVGTGDERVGQDSGILLAINTCGVLVGTFLVPFSLVPLIGSPRGLVLLALSNACLGMALLEAARRAGLMTRLAVVGLGAPVVLLAAGALLVRSALIADPSETRIRRAGRLFASAEDEIASVQAGRIGSMKHLWVGGNAMTALTVEAKLMAILPVMLRPRAGSMLVIAFGMGSSFRSALIAGLEVDAVELVPSVPKMFGYYYADARDVLANPRGRTVIADGRNHVELTDRRYDLIVVDPPPPIESSGTAVLYSREFYEASAARLTQGGLMMEWMPYGQSVDDFRAHVRTFAHRFPFVMIAFGPGEGGTFLFGSREPIGFDESSIREVLARPGVLADLSEAFDSPATRLEQWASLIPRLVWISGADVTRFGGEGPLMTDDRPLTEYFLLRRVFGPKSPPTTSSSLMAASDVR